MPVPEGPDADEHDDVAFANRSRGRTFDGVDRVALVGEHPRGTAVSIHAVGIDRPTRSIAVALMTEPCGARLPSGNTTVLVRPRDVPNRAP
jgi:hypothetical protein